MGKSFEAALTFDGARPGMVFKLGVLGLGYYVDPLQGKTAVASAPPPTAAPVNTEDASIEELRKKLPERWRGASFRVAALCVHATQGAGISLEHSDFGFLVEEVAELPGQDLQPGEVIVAVEDRILAGLVEAQMQASFQKRRLHGARLTVGWLAELQEQNSRNPDIVENWDRVHQHAYFLNKKTGRTAWTREELEAQAEAEAEAQSAQTAAAAAPIDLANFMKHGFAKPPEPKIKKKVKRKADDAQLTKDASDVARQERARWGAWNSGERGGYTEQFLEKYKNCQSFPSKEKSADKRLKGSVGPGFGMDNFARWTGSKNSFN
mmetsp:Transcript_37548/g.86717  ORF Transcript_37548/g.86717 Transcript_37548/m.86717 type:complete len:322 (+) Transcript_37548:67-1032(+)|eukprot:4956476-Amphidinium_carterae.1